MKVSDFLTEVWTYVGIAFLIVLARVIGRWHAIGFRALAPDDYLMVVAFLLYVGETLGCHFNAAVWSGRSNSGPFPMTDEQRAALDPVSEEYSMRVHGSQTQMYGWLVYTCMMWTLKICWLFFYKRLGDGINNMRLKINIGFALVAVTFVGAFLVILLACFPVEKHWQIYPDPGNTCHPAVSRVQAWTVMTTNLATDFYIMAIPLPLIWTARISLKKKISLVFMLYGGLVTAVFGGLRCGVILKSIPDSKQAGEWSCREGFVAILFSNIPVIAPIIRRGASKVKEASSRGKSTSSGTGQSKDGGVGFKLGSLRTFGSAGEKKKFRHPLSLPGGTFGGDTVYERYESDEERIVDPVDRTEDNVMKTVEWRIDSREAQPSEIEAHKGQRINGFNQARGADEGFRFV